MGFVPDGVCEKQWDQRKRLGLPILTETEKPIFREIHS
jgi:hypothetical protein